MSEKIIRKVLNSFELTNNEADVYIFLAKKGISKGQNIVYGLKKDKSHVYRILKNLQSKNLVEKTLEYPSRFIAIPFKKILNLQIMKKKEEVSTLENMKNDLLNHWGTIKVKEDEFNLEKCVIIHGRNRIYSKVFQMLEEAKKEVLVVISGFTLVQTIQMEINRAFFSKARKSNFKLRLLTHLSQEKYDILKKYLNSVSLKNLKEKIQGRHIDSGAGLYTRFLLKDEEEAILFITLDEGLSINGPADSSLWTNSKAIINILKVLFEELWLKGIDIREKIIEIEKKKIS